MAKLGDKRERTWFAIIPTKVQGKWIWFEKYIKCQEYKNVTVRNEYVVSSGLIEDTLTTTGLLNERTVTKYEDYPMWKTYNRKLIVNKLDT